MSDTPGFEIHGQFYPWIPFDDWKLADPRLVRALTGYNERELLTGVASARIINAAFAAVAFRRVNPAASEAEVVKFFEGLNPDSEIKLVGFNVLKQQGTDADPPEQSGSGSSSSSEPSPEPTQETSPPNDDGTQPSETGSDSDPQT